MLYWQRKKVEGIKEIKYELTESGAYENGGCLRNGEKHLKSIYKVSNVNPIYKQKWAKIEE